MKLLNLYPTVNGGVKLVHLGGVKLVHLMYFFTVLQVVPVVHRRAPRGLWRAPNTLTQQGAWEVPVDPPGQPWSGWLKPVRYFLGISAGFGFG